MIKEGKFMKHLVDMTLEERQKHIEKKGKQKAYNKMNDKLKYIMKEKIYYGKY